jgi:hypothetical protein
MLAVLFRISVPSLSIKSGELYDLPRAELNLLDTGHFALEEEGDFIAERIKAFLTE